MPNYTGTVALLVGFAFTVLHLFGVPLPGDDMKQSLTGAVVGLVTSISIIIGIWRLMFTKGVVHQLSAQLLDAGHQPVAGPQQDERPAGINNPMMSGARRVSSLILLAILAAVALTACGTISTFFGTPSQKTKTTILEVYSDTCRAFSSTEKLAAQAIDAHLLTLAFVNEIEAAQKIGDPVCTGPLPANLGQVIIDVGLATVRISTALSEGKAN